MFLSLSVFVKYFPKNNCIKKNINMTIINIFWYFVLIIVLKLVYNIHDSVFNKIT